MWGLINHALNCTWFFGLDAKKSWVVLSGLLGGFDSRLVDHSNVFGQIGAPPTFDCSISQEDFTGSPLYQWWIETRSSKW